MKVVIDDSLCIVIEQERLSGEVERYTVTDVDGLVRELRAAQAAVYVREHPGSQPPTPGYKASIEDLLREHREGLPEGHHERSGLRRAEEIVHHYAREAS